MPIDHNFDVFAKALSEAPDEYKAQVQDPLKEFIGKRFGSVSSNEYMREGPTLFESDNYPPRRSSGPLRILSGRLQQAVRGASKGISTGRGQGVESETVAETTENGFVWIHRIFVPYALIHEKGGTIPAHRIPVTQKMESFFWAKFYETGTKEPQTKIDVARGNKWRRMAIAAKNKTHFEIPPVDIPARPYIEPALQDIIPEVEQRGISLINDFLEKEFNL